MLFEESIENCYWLGFLLGDGSVKKHPKSKTRSLKLTLSAKDKEHLRKFNDWFGGDYSIREFTSDGYKQIETVVYDQAKINCLRRLGVKENKTESLTLPDTQNRSALIRGYSDADGYIGAPGGNGFNWSIASKSESALKKAKEMIQVPSGKIYWNEAAGTYYLRYGKISVADDMFDFLYPDGLNTTPVLERKMRDAHERAAWSLKKTKDTELEKYA